MSDTIPVTLRQVGDCELPTVDCREVHAVLAPHTTFDSWLPRLIKRGGLVVDRDYLQHQVPSGILGRGRPSREYHVALDALTVTLTLDGVKAELIANGTGVSFTRVMPERERKVSSSLYFIRCHDYIKIGITHDVAHRLKHLQMANPVKLELVVAVAGDRSTELQLHQKFAAFHIRGEWFYFATAIRDYCATLAVTQAVVEPQFGEPRNHHRATVDLRRRQLDLFDTLTTDGPQYTPTIQLPLVATAADLAASLTKPVPLTTIMSGG